jgi:hypothetical protein
MLENVRCTMAGDAYSFVIENFQEENVGRYTITAENYSGKATCSAEVLFEGSEFNQLQYEFFEPINEKSYKSEIIEKSNAESDFILENKIQSSSNATKVVSSEFNNQSLLKEISSQSQELSLNNRETGIQIKNESKDKSSQIEVINKRDESSQWTSPEVEIERFSKVVNEPGAPFVATAESHFSSSNVDENSVSHSYSYTQKSLAYSSGNSKTANTVIDSNFPHIDFSTTLIKDINQHFEPVELILNRNESSSLHQHQVVPTTISSNMSSSTYVREIDNFHHRHHLNRFEPVNLIIHKPLNRSGSLPPLVSRLNFKSAGRSDFEHNETEDEYFYSNYADRSYHDHSFISSAERLNYIRELENRRASRLSFKPVELVLEASSTSIYDSGKRYRDMSLPSLMGKRIRIPLKHENLISSSFIYDNYNNNYNYDYEYDYDTQYSDFISDQRFDKEIRYRYAPYATKSHFSSVEEREITSNVRPTTTTRNKLIEQKLPAMEMTIDLKAPPTMDVPLKNISVQEGHIAKLECIVSGKLFFNMWFD